MKAKIDRTSVKESTGGGGYISTSGVYDVTIERASVKETTNGALSLDITLMNEAGNSTTIYNNILKTKDGSDVDKNGKMLPGMALLNKIMIINGIEELDDPEEQELKLGKDNKEVTLNVLTDLDDLPLKVQVQQEYSVIPEGYKNAGQISEKLVLRSVFRQEDGASAEELFADSEGEEVEFGGQLKLIQERGYDTKISYRDGLTEDDVEKWKKERASGNKSDTPAPKAKPKNKKAGSLFSK